MPERWAEMLPALGKNAVLHKIVKCKHDINTAAVELAKGELVWRNNSGGNKRSRSNFSTFDETAATMKAKMHFLKMLEHRLERAGSAYSDEDFDTCMALGRYIADKEQDIKRIADRWSETSAEFRNRASAELARRENLPALDGNEEDDPTGEEAEADEEEVVEAAAATQNEEEMVTDADIEEILDDIEQEDEETDKEDSAVQEEEENEDGGKEGAEGQKEANVNDEMRVEEANVNDEVKMDDNVGVADEKRKEEDSEKEEAGEEKHAEEKQEEATPMPTPDSKTQEQVHLRPYLLSLQDGAADLPIWMRRMKTYFTLSNFSEKEPSTQQAVVMSYMDDEMGKFLQQEMEGVEANLTNLLAAIQYIFDQMYPRCVRCGETEDYQRNPHCLNNSGCLTKEMEEDKEESEDKEEDKDAEGCKTGGNEATPEGEKEEGEAKSQNILTGLIDLVGPDHDDPSSGITLQRKTKAVVMFKQRENLVPTLAVADTGSTFSLMWETFANLNNIDWIKNDTIVRRFQLVDLSGTTIKVIGYVDLEVNSVDGVINDEEYKKIRVLIVGGDEMTTVILGIRDLEVLRIVPGNFPFPMDPISAAVENRARARTQLEMEYEDGNLKEEDGSDEEGINDHPPRLPTPVPAYKTEENVVEDLIKTNEWNKVKEVVKKANEKMNTKQDLREKEDQKTEFSAALAQVKNLLAEEMYNVAKKEKVENLFLWRAEMGGQEGGWVSDMTVDRGEEKVADEKEKMADFEKLRTRLLRYGLQQIMHISQVFQMSAPELIETIVRENEKMGHFPNTTRHEVFQLMTEECDSGCKAADPMEKTLPCLTCRRRNAVIADLATGLVEAMESAESEIKARSDQSGAWPSQSKTATQGAGAVNYGEMRAPEISLRRRLNEFESCTLAGQDDIRRQLNKIQTILKNIRKDVSGGRQGGNGDHLEENVRKRGMVHHMRAVCDDLGHHHSDNLDDNPGQMGENQEDGGRGNKDNTAKGRAAKIKYPRKPNKGKYDKYYVN